MDSELIKNIVLGAARHVLTYGGGWLMSQGYLQQSQMDGWLGSGMFIAALIWSMVSKKKADNKLVEVGAK